jgi:hypothetical protein
VWSRTIAGQPVQCHLVPIRAIGHFETNIWYLYPWLRKIPDTVPVFLTVDCGSEHLDELVLEERENRGVVRRAWSIRDIIRFDLDNEPGVKAGIVPDVAQPAVFPLAKWTWNLSSLTVA